MTEPNTHSDIGIAQCIFSLDLRSLALFRIALGCLILADLAFRFSTLGDMYTGDGFFTHDLAGQYYQELLGVHWQQYAWSLYWISDSNIFVQAAFAVAAAAALFLVFGKWTRLATIASWILLVSLQVRNPLVTTSGDFLFKMLLFWSMFLPLGAVWSCDAVKRKTDYDLVCSFATVGLVFQVFAIYFFPGIAKWNNIWISGDAMWYVLRLDIYITPIGRSLLDYPFLLRLVSWFTLIAEIIWVWTLFTPWKNGLFRMINLVIFWAFHIGIAMSMAIGLFSAICIVAWLALLPALVWGINKSPPRVINHLDLSTLSTPQLAVEIFCAAMLLLIVTWNVSNIDHPITRAAKVPLLKQLVHQAGVFQEFQMFGGPPQVNPWFVYEAQLADGTTRDIFRNEPVRLERPERGLDKMPQFHWRKLHRNAVHSQRKVIRQPMLDYAVKQWNEKHPLKKEIVKARLIFFKEEIGPDFNALNHTSQVWGSYENESKSAGSLFDSMLNDADPF